MPTRRTMSEAQLEAEFANRARLLGWRTIKVVPTEEGSPHRMLLLPDGMIRIVALKTCNGQLSLGQKVWHQRAQELGTTVVVLYGYDHLVRWFARLVENMTPRPGRPGRPSKEMSTARNIENWCAEQGHRNCHCSELISTLILPWQKREDIS